MDARTIAFAVLRRVEEQEAFANLALDAELSQAGILDPRDAALATELAYGVLRRRVALDRALAPLVRGGLEALEPKVVDLLRLGAYQLLFTRVPPHAAVGETVATARRVGLARAAGLINAVLRRLGREGAPPPPDPARDPVGALEVQGSLPRWLAERLLERLGPDEALRFAAAIDQPAPPTARANRLRIGREELGARIAAEAAGARIRPTPLAPDGLTVEGGGSLTRLPSFAEGLFSQQDEAAQLVGHLCAPAPGATVLDACAAPGGKSCHLAELGAGSVISMDVHERKARRIGDEARRLGLEEVVHPLAGDATRPLPEAARGPFDLVLVDAPCSALGTLRRHPELRYRRTAADVARMAETQARILDNVAGVVRPGGTLVYAVCSVLPEEGPERVRAFLERHPDFAPAPLDPAPAWSEAGWILDAWPHRQGIDGFYAARLRRR